ncbi:Uma2 family endonuclease [Methylobacterium sp. NEAU 140]|uniref:Uma2 family endonuclease n=1 Tax=Methylobacterium sp. NEAU 140 TaxID=3064945 RepID=UPI002733ED6F|nr:Uma2 family endonuclease [Methylobacterium sp. NEAU 140]MDP4024076.1 Uma2 family endonuclease [Methylobacterium sp. NEAU 140]
MADPVQRSSALTIAAFDSFVAGQRDDRDWELVDGELVMMTNPTENHEQIAGNVGAPLKLAMDAAGCRSYQGGMRVQRSDDGRGRDKTKPDIVVRCGPRQNQTYVTDPVVVVEVLSPSTMDHDRGGKLAFYKSLPTLRHIALIYQDQMRVEHYRRDEAGWTMEVLVAPGTLLRFEAVDFEIDLDRIYFDVPVPRAIIGADNSR